MKYSNPLSRIYCAFTQEQAFRYEAAVLAFLIAAVLWAEPHLTTAALLIGGWLSVMAFELVNGAVERAFNLIDAKHNPEIKAGKDMLSVAVFLMIIFNMLLWLVLAMDYID